MSSILRIPPTKLILLTSDFLRELHQCRVSFRKKKSSKNVDTAPVKDEPAPAAAPAAAAASASTAEPNAAPSPAAPEKPVEEAREPEVSLSTDTTALLIPAMVYELP